MMTPAPAGDGGDRAAGGEEAARPGRRRRRKRRPGESGAGREAGGEPRREPRREPNRAEGGEGLRQRRDDVLGGERLRQEKPHRKKLEDLDDDFVKTDYFAVDDSIIRRAEPAPGPRGPAERASGDRKGDRAAGGGSGSERKGRPASRKRRRRGGSGKKGGRPQGRGET